MGSNKTSRLNRVIVKLTKAANKARKKMPAQRKSSSSVRNSNRMKFGLTSLKSTIPMFRVQD